MIKHFKMKCKRPLITGHNHCFAPYFSSYIMYFGTKIIVYAKVEKDGFVNVVLLSLCRVFDAFVSFLHRRL